MSNWRCAIWCAVAGTADGRLVWRGISMRRLAVRCLAMRRLAIWRLWGGSVVSGGGLRRGSTVVCALLRGRVAVALLRRVLALRRSTRRRTRGRTVWLLRVGRLLVALRRTRRCTVRRLSVCAVRRLCGRVSKVPAVRDEVTHGSAGDIDKTLWIVRECQKK